MIQLPLLAEVPTRGSAVLSADQRYRYLLKRWIGPGVAHVLWVMLNPSTADHQVDDPTIRRVLGFSAALGFGLVEVVNLFALRSPEPYDLAEAEDPIGPQNDYHLAAAGVRVADSPGSRIVVGWGAAAKVPGRLIAGRIERVRRLLAPSPLWCLGTTAQGDPRHPLFVPGSKGLEPWTS